MIAQSLFFMLRTGKEPGTHMKNRKYMDQKPEYAQMKIIMETGTVKRIYI